MNAWCVFKSDAARSTCVGEGSALPYIAIMPIDCAMLYPRSTPIPSPVRRLSWLMLWIVASIRLAAFVSQLALGLGTAWLAKTRATAPVGV
jgi:hypothetical protein